MSEPCQEWVVARLAATQAAMLRIRPADIPIASTIEINVDCRTGKRVVALPYVATEKPVPPPAPRLIELPPARPPRSPIPGGTCPRCGQWFKRTKRSQVFCSVACCHAARHPEDRHCLHCKAPFTPQNSNRQYCGRACYQADWKGRHSERMRKIAHAMHDRADIDQSQARHVVEIVAEVYGLMPDELMADTRLATIVRPRQAVMLLLDDVLRATKSGIGRYFKRDHSTTVHSVRVCRLRVETDVRFGMLYRDAEARVRAAFPQAAA